MHKINELLKNFSENKGRSNQELIEYRLNWIKLIRSFIIRFDFEHVKEEDLSRFRRGQYNEKDELVVDVTLHPDNLKK